MRDWINLFENHTRDLTGDEMEAMDIDVLDMLAYGVKGDDIVELLPDDIHIKYTDLENPEYRFEKEGMAWVNSVSFETPVDVSVAQNGTPELEDGHHRWFAAKKLGRKLKAKIEIKGNPILRILELQREGRPLTPKFPPSELKEAIVHRDQFVQQHNTRKTIIAVNPTKQEWAANFPRGAAGVICKDGRVAIGDGDCLAHDVILDMAGIDQSQEMYRLQICHNIAWAELWLDDDELANPRDPNPEEVDQAIIKHYGASIAEIEATMHECLSRFMPGADFKAIPMNFNGGLWIPEDNAFRSRCSVNKDA